MLRPICRFHFTWITHFIPLFEAAPILSCGHLTACMCFVLSVCLTLCSLQPDEALSDDFLFPMTSLRLSYASSPESDLEQGSLPPRLVKCSSDPSIATQEDSQPAPPPYTPPHQYQVRFITFIDDKCFTNTQ